DRTQRYDLLRAVAADQDRHLILVTATPHSGKEDGFRNLLGLLDPTLAEVNLDDPAGRSRLARHFVQRRRADIRTYLREDTVFPADRLTREAPYELSPQYKAFFDRVLNYARQRVAGAADPAVPALRRRVQWWSALALLRALSSSPAAAASTLRTRAATAEATTVEEADALGRSSVLDRSDDETLESLDTTPGADLSVDDAGTTAQPASGERRRLLELARDAETLAGPVGDHKLAALIGQVKGLLAGGDAPIVFCRFIDTADYVAEHLQAGLGAGVSVASVTGDLPPELRRERIAELAGRPGRRVLVATDCLSEGVNLQDHFSAVVHYDLAWNPTRHEQREGRVDRFGQQRDVVRAVTVYGRDNPVDGIVLEVLIRKHQAIRAATGVSVPVPDRSDDLVEALIEGLILRGQTSPDQLTLDLGLAERRDGLHRDWDSAAERERRSQTKYAQQAIHPDEIARDVEAARAEVGDPEEIERFTLAALRALGGPPTAATGGWQASTVGLPPALRASLPAPLSEPLTLRRDLPAPPGAAVLARTDPTVEAIARWVLDTALDPQGDRSVAARAGVTRTRGVTRRTTLLLVRYRFHLDMPSRHGLRQQVAEEARIVGFAGSPIEPDWLDPDTVAQVLAAPADANIPADQAAAQAERILADLHLLGDALDQSADRLADELLDAHRRVRAGANAYRRGLAVTAQHPPDVLGVYLYLPAQP
ncbi:MAG: helicase-related protein, partial [Acidimicrobiales bacterium]